VEGWVREKSGTTSVLHPILLFTLSHPNLPQLPTTDLTKEVDAPFGWVEQIVCRERILCERERKIDNYEECKIGDTTKTGE
jgi:hypothetical protein